MSPVNESRVGPVIGRRMLTYYVGAEFALLTGNLLVRVCNRAQAMPGWLTIGLAIATAVPMILFAIHFFRMLRTELDEMLQRIVLDALAFTLVVFVPITGLYVNLRAAGMASLRLDPPELLLAPSMLVAAGILYSLRRLK